MPDIQLNPAYSTLASLTESDYLAPYKLLAFQENVIKFLPVSLLGSSAGGAAWQALIYQVSNAIVVDSVHIITLQELSDLILLVCRETLDSKLFVSLNNPAWDKVTTTYLDFIEINLATGAHVLINELSETYDQISLRADAHVQTELNNVQRLTLNAPAIVTNGAVLLLCYRGVFENCAVHVVEGRGE